MKALKDLKQLNILKSKIVIYILTLFHIIPINQDFYTD